MKLLRFKYLLLVILFVVSLACGKSKSNIIKEVYVNQSKISCCTIQSSASGKVIYVISEIASELQIGDTILVIDSTSLYLRKSEAYDDFRRKQGNDFLIRMNLDELEKQFENLIITSKYNRVPSKVLVQTNEFVTQGTDLFVYCFDDK